MKTSSISVNLPPSADPSRLVRRLSGVVAWGARLTCVVVLAAYLTNMGAIFLNPTSPVMWETIQKTSSVQANGTKSETFSSTFINRFSIEVVGKDRRGVVALSGAQIPLANMTPLSWVVYGAYTTLVMGTGLAFLMLLASLFFGFAKGRIFTEGSIRKLRWIGFLILAFAGLVVAEMLAAIGLFYTINNEVFVSESSIVFNLPLETLAMGFLITILALVFEEGRRIEEESAFTI